MLGRQAAWSREPTLMMVLVLVAGCLVPNEDFDEPTGSSASTSAPGSSSSTDTSEGSTGEGSGDTKGASQSTGSLDSESGTPATCEAVPEPWEDDCPAVCTAGCQGQVCLIECGAAGQCQHGAIECPPGLHCLVACTGTAACMGVTVQCPSEHECRVECSNESACKSTTVQCSDGVCSMSCIVGNEVCMGAQFLCGTRDSVVECRADRSPPELIEHPRSGCRCESEGCPGR